MPDDERLGEPDYPPKIGRLRAKPAPPRNHVILTATVAYIITILGLVGLSYLVFH